MPINLKHPSKKTLDKYGLSHDDWCEIAARQFGVCAVCGKLPKSGRLNIDHFHVKNWKKKPPEERKKYVRGLLCYMCNLFYMARGMEIYKASNIIKYLKRFEVEQLNEKQSASS